MSPLSEILLTSHAAPELKSATLLVADTGVIIIFAVKSYLPHRWLESMSFDLCGFFAD